jgi:hypothetical protein
MKTLISCMFLLTCSIMKPISTHTDPLSRLEGTWYVTLSNFKMWLKGNKHNPAFTYTLQTRKGIKGLKDVVSYEKNHKPKQLLGFDKPCNEGATAFIWRGNGLLGLFKSKWEIVYSTAEWTLIHFQKTLATAEGYDVISRQKRFSPEMLIAIEAKLKELGVPELQVIEQN